MAKRFPLASSTDRTYIAPTDYLGENHLFEIRPFENLSGMQMAGCQYGTVKSDNGFLMDTSIVPDIWTFGTNHVCAGYKLNLCRVIE